TLTASVNAVAMGGSVLLTATVAGTGPSTGGTPTGTVTFFNGSTVLGTAAVAYDTVSGTYRARLSTTGLNAGANSLTASYAGDNNYAGSDSAALSVTANTAPTVSISSSTGSTVYGQAVTLTATVSAAAGSVGQPQGTVSFVDVGTGTTLGTISL